MYDDLINEAIPLKADSFRLKEVVPYLEELDSLVMKELRTEPDFDKVKGNQAVISLLGSLVRRINDLYNDREQVEELTERNRVLSSHATDY